MLAGTALNVVVSNSAHSLRQHLAKLVSADTRAFVEESIVCFEANQYRAAIVLSWVGAMSLLHHYVYSMKLADFEVEALARDPRWRKVNAVDDLGRMKEHDFLDVCERIGVLGKNVKQQLQTQLQLRNGCGHPNTLKIAENSVAAHIEVLLLNVFLRF